MNWVVLCVGFHVCHLSLGMMLLRLIRVAGCVCDPFAVTLGQHFVAPGATDLSIYRLISI